MSNPIQSPLASALGIVLQEDQEAQETIRIAAEEAAAAAAKALIPVAPPTITDMIKVDVKVDNDADTARDTLLNMIGKNNTAIDQLLDIARESMTPRAYEVVGNLIRHNADIAEKLLKIHADKQKVQNNAINLVRNEQQFTGNTPNPTGNTNIVNIDKAVFTGTTSELLELVRTAKPVIIFDQTAEDDEADVKDTGYLASEDPDLG
jgi:hypothetical protein